MSDEEPIITSKDLQEIKEFVEKEYPNVEIEWVFDRREKK